MCVYVILVSLIQVHQESAIKFEGDACLHRFAAILSRVKKKMTTGAWLGYGTTFFSTTTLEGHELYIFSYARREAKGSDYKLMKT